MIHAQALRRFIFCTTLLLGLSALTSGALYAEQSPEEVRRILQDSLSIVEIDHEIERIDTEQSKLQSQLAGLRTSLAQQEQDIKEHREKAGRVMRSYYMGERDTLLNLLFKAKSLTQMLTLYDYYQIIISNDQAVLHDYQERYRSMTATQTKLVRASDELSRVKNSLIEQRARVAALQQQVDDHVALSSDPEAIRRMIGELTQYWENVGLHEVKRYFEALASAMQGLPNFIQQQPGAIETNGRNYTIRIEEDAFNDYLRAQNELFQHFAFHFSSEGITASGQQGNLQLSIQGHYTVENDPQNAILFHVDKLIFNQLELPDTTRQTMEEQFDLGFYPEQLISFLKATSVSTSDKELKVELQLSL
ncbi:hypothetical protein Q5741_03235 [Paenibacillus sp. JX-17]|uniref:N-terminal domain of peptidoglycan hydrolase CwlO-containing protein n=1 Tax=Paenibacillus lacisoli TaxID=3064525 RepID=A0ABT9C9V5_9BACL|nr:hypothetical protein [Paenibacillus sp. JX-17]MDO7905424.1 hypothetical protein [Paenibacillus sp. JX-17]